MFKLYFVRVNGKHVCSWACAFAKLRSPEETEVVDKTWVVNESLPFGGDAANTLVYEINENEIPADVASGLKKEDLPVGSPQQPPAPPKDTAKDPEKTPPAPVPLIRCMDQTFLDFR